MAEQRFSISTAQRLRAADLFSFTPSLVADLFGLERRQAYRLIERLQAEDLVDEVEKGKYILLGLEPERVLSNPLHIGCHLVAPSYVSYWSALHFHGFTEQVPLTTLVATTRKKRPLTYRAYRFRFVTQKPHKFFGYRREVVGDLPVTIADEAKAIVDSLDIIGHSGGMGEVAGALRNALHEQEMDVPLLVEYANRMENRSLGSRLGYLLESFGWDVQGLLCSSTPVRLDPHRPRAGRLDSHWRVIINLREEQISGAGGIG